MFLINLILLSCQKKVAVLLPISFWLSLNNHNLHYWPFCKTFRKYSMVFFRLSSSGITGSQARSFLALVISGRRLTGSSLGSSTCIIFDLESMRFIISSENYNIVISLGFPIFTGPVNSSGESIIFINPSIISLT